MKQVDIKIEKTARYFVLGKPSLKIKTVWFVCHGYGQLASYFLKWFDSINDGSTLIVAPEGLNRFYWNGFSGNVVASWMTKEDRLTDIGDYVTFLDKVASEVLKDLGKVTVNILGFSQGTGTATRWTSLGKTKADHLILWAGSFPDDIDYFENKNLFDDLNLQIVIGDNDDFLTEKAIDKELKKINKKGINFTLTRFNGGHKILPKPLLKLQKTLSK